MNPIKEVAIIASAIAGANVLNDIGSTFIIPLIRFYYNYQPGSNYSQQVVA